jgi:hypothetical protein
MSPIDERLKALGVVLPNVMPPVVDGYVRRSLRMFKPAT